MFTCQFIARSVRHCNASPSGKRAETFWRLTKRANIVSNRGRRDRKQHGHRNFMSLEAGDLPLYDVLGKGTQFAMKYKSNKLMLDKRY
jgi:hypothetical protein